MRSSLKLAAAVAATCGLAALAASPAAAKCTRLGFLVNDYGKDGPTKDAKALLDKHIAAWAAEHKITKYTTGKKDVSCELFLDFIVFDEHTCTASATVCWDDKAPGVLPVQDAKTPVEVKPATAAKTKPATEKPATAPATQPKGPAKAAAAEKAAAKPVETGAIPARKPDAPAPTPAATESDKAAEAAVSAAKAAAAAERAAAAAERAAAAVAEKTKAAASAAPESAPAPSAAPIAPAPGGAQ